MRHSKNGAGGIQCKSFLRRTQYEWSVYMVPNPSNAKSENFFAVFDIGKTNKKIAIFDEKLKIIHKESVQMGEKNVDGFLADPVEEMGDWFIGRLKALASKFNIKSIGITTFGATAAFLDGSGSLAFPVISYNHDPGDDNRKKFHEKFGSAEKLYLETATPPYGQLLNSGVQAFWLKENFPGRFGAVSEMLFLPQYEGKILTGKSAVEPTYLGCHNYLYNFTKKSLSSVSAGLGLDDKMPKKISNPWDALGTAKPEICKKTGLSKDCMVAVGMHDSNASLLPYLLKENGRFLLASTGTWCVFMQPGSKFRLSGKDMRKDTMYFMDAFGRPNRASIFRGGKEHDHYSDLIQNRFGNDPRKIRLNAGLLEETLKSNSSFVIPTLIPGSGQFPKSKARIISEGEFYESAERAYHILNLSIAIQSYYAILQVSGRGSKCPIFVEGGFANNGIYLAILSTLFPERDVYVTEIREATSLGAAICAKCAFDRKDPRRLDPELIEIKKSRVPKIPGIGKELKSYVASFERHCSSRK